MPKNKDLFYAMSNTGGTKDLFPRSAQTVCGVDAEYKWPVAAGDRLQGLLLCVA